MAAAVRRRGFTLIEILVVVALVSVITAAVLLSIPSRSTAELQRLEANRLSARMTIAREEAMLRARTFGLRVEPDGYRFLQRRDAGWHGFADDHPLRHHRIPEVLRLELEVEGADIGLGDDDAGDDSGDGPVPQIYFLAGGEILPGYALHVLGEDSGAEYTIAPGEEQWIEVTETRQ